MLNFGNFIKFTIIVTIVSSCFSEANAQWSVSYHQSNISFAAVSYDINDRFVPEFRLGTNVDYDFRFSPEFVFTYKPILKDDYHMYFGGGVIINDNWGGLHTPVGMQIYPFDNKHFGFIMELSPVVISFDNDPWVRGSMGIRYRFLED